MPEENIVGIVCGRSDVWAGSTQWLFSKCSQQNGVADVEVLEMPFRANISPRSVYDQFLGPVKIRMLLLNEAVCNVEYSRVL